MQPFDVSAFLSGAEILLPEATGMILRRLVASDYAELLSFRSDVVSAIADPDIIRLAPNENEYVREMLHSDHVVLGLYRDNALTAFNGQFLPVTDEHLRGLLIDRHMLGRAKPSEITYAAGVMVAPQLRGQKLQALLIEARAHIMQTLGRPCHVATVAFSNHHSWRNILDSGARVISLFEFDDPRYGPTSRMLTFRTPTPPALVGETVWVDAKDFGRNRALLETGFVGTAYREHAGRLELSYRHEAPTI
jgi:hypothetical protein